MAPERVKVFVVDDHERWRRFICSILETQPQLHVIGSATDGFEAVQKAQELAPDLMVLDIGLPNLNGIEAARRITELSPHTRVLMVSQNAGAEVAESAFRMGALGYVVKSSADRELLPAVNAVLQRKRFVSACLTGRPTSTPRPVDIPGLHRLRTKGAPLPPRELARRRRHEVEFYPDHAALVAGFTRCVEAGIKNGSVVIMIASEFHRARVFQRLKANGVDAERLIEDGRLFSLDAEETLSAFMVNEMPDPVRCAQMLHDFIASALRNPEVHFPQITICGECAPMLLAKGKTDAAIRLEHLWDVITEGHDADTLCGYVWGAMPSEERNLIVTRLCEEHSAIRGHELRDPTFA